MRENRTWNLVVVGVIGLAVICAVLAWLPSLGTSSFNGWTGESSFKTGNFYAGIFLVLGLVEIGTALIRRIWGRILGILAILMKTVLPWAMLSMYRELGAVAMDMSFTIKMISPVPYVILGLCVVSIIFHVCLAFEKRRT